jgi:predicted unusual protein kinase regulating ubiquinone biosynthesis (AarF/ABC1/UbiB family)
MVKEKQSPFARGFRMGRLGLSLTGSYLGYQVQNLFSAESSREERRRAFNQKASRQIREELQSLKGAVMKIGQALSMQNHALPLEVTEELAHLQMKAPGMHSTLARAQFKGSYGQAVEEVFREFEAEPFAAASLGQVHRAVTKSGERVAIKIQYPAIRTAVENDFKLLRSATLPGKFSGHFPKSVLDEMESGILKETDYLNEAKNIEFFDQKLKHIPYVEVPRVFPQLSTDRILTMSFLEGLTLEEFLAEKPSQTLRDLLGWRLFDLFHLQLRRIHAVHADPHPGNYLFRRDAAIALLDFGSVKYISPDLQEIIACFEGEVWERGEAEFARMTKIICGDKARTKPRETRKTMEETIVFYRKIFPGGVVDFGDPDVINTLTTIWRKFLRHKIVHPGLIFCSRAELGLYNMLHRLKARVDTEEILRKARKIKLG